MERVLVITIASSMFGVLYSIVLSEGISFGLVNGVLNGIFIGLLDTIWVRKRRGSRLRQLSLINYTWVLTLIWTLIILTNMTLTRHWLELNHGPSLQWMRSEEFGRHFLY